MLKAQDFWITKVLLQELLRVPDAGSQGQDSVATYTRARRQAETRPFRNQLLWGLRNLATAVGNFFSLFSLPAALGSGGGREPLLLGQSPPLAPGAGLAGRGGSRRARQDSPAGRGARPWRGYPRRGRFACPSPL